MHGAINYSRIHVCMHIQIGSNYAKWYGEWSVYGNIYRWIGTNYESMYLNYKHV